MFEALVPARPGEDYRFLVDGVALPDPCSRWQPDGSAGPLAGARQAGGRPSPFAAPALDELVIYELHVGTFTPEGTFAAAIPHLAELAALGVTAIEIMPVAEFPGRARVGLRRRLPLRRAVLLRRPARALAARRAPRTSAAWR